MSVSADQAPTTRPLTEHERSLARWMLEQGNADASSYLDQLEQAQASAKRCPCGCATFGFCVAGRTEAPPGVNILASFLFGTDDDPKEVFIFSSGGILSGLEVVGYVSDAPKTLPNISDLRSLPGS